MTRSLRIGRQFAQGRAKQAAVSIAPVLRIVKGRAAYGSSAFVGTADDVDRPSGQARIYTQAIAWLAQTDPPLRSHCSSS